MKEPIAPKADLKKSYGRNENLDAKKRRTIIATAIALRQLKTTHRLPEDSLDRLFDLDWKRNQ